MSALPKAWATARFQDVVSNLSTDGHVVQTKEIRDSGPVRVLTQGEPSNDGYTLDLSRAYEDDLPLIVFGDHTRAIKLAEEPFAVGPNAKVLSVRPGLSTRFLYYQLPTHLPRARGYGRHYQFLLKSTVVVAPFREQERIVAAIEEQFSRLAFAETLLRRSKQRLDALRAAVITSLTEGSWPRFPWKEVGTSQNGRAFPSRDYCDTGVRLLRPGNLHASGRVVWTDQNTRHLPTRYEEEFPSYVVGPHELIMNLTAQSLKDEFLGRVCLTGADEHSLLNQRLARLRPLEADVRYIQFVFKARPFRMYVASLNKGTLIQHMFTSQLADFPIAYPPLFEQQRIVGEIDANLSTIDTATCTVERGLARGDVLRHAILQRAFAGALMPQDPDDEPATVLLERIAADKASSSNHKPVRASKPKAPLRNAGSQEQETRRMGIQLMWEDGYSMAEIAETMEISTTNLGNEMTRMRKDGWNLPYRRRKATA